MTGSLPADRWLMAELVPHAAPMILLDRVIAIDATSLWAAAHLDSNCPFVDGSKTVLAAWWTLEYLAQGIAAFAGYRARIAGQSIPWGYLTSCRKFSSNAPYLMLPVDAEISVTENLSVNDSLASFQCYMRAGHFESSAQISVFAAKKTDD